MEITGVALGAAGMISLAGLPFAMAWVEETLMTTSERGQAPEPSEAQRTSG